MTKYYPKALTLLVETNTDDVSYKKSPDGCTYVRYDKVPDAHPLLYGLLTLTAFLCCLVALLNANWVDAIVLGFATPALAWIQWRIQKQWQAIHDALPD